MRLTALLRSVLRSEGEFTTLGRELELIESYLDIERARFEERLRVRIDVPAALRSLRVPPLVLQPIVENAVKHGIAPQRGGGDVTVTARLEPAAGGADAGRSSSTTRAPASARPRCSAGRAAGVGLRNVERRLALPVRRRGVAVDRERARRRHDRRDPHAGRIPGRRAELDVDAARVVNARLRVVVADDERPARSFLAALLRSFDDVVGRRRGRVGQGGAWRRSSASSRTSRCSICRCRSSTASASCGC